MNSNPGHYYDSFADEVAAKFRRIGHIIPNRAATGNYHEEILRSVLRNFLSKRFSVKTGFIYKNEQEVSNQLDIIIVDEYEASAYIYQEGDFVIVRPWSVIAVLEVKTTLYGPDFDKALENIASAKRLADNPDRICGMVFGYNSTKPSPATLDQWFQRPAAAKLAATPRLGPTLFSFFRRGVLLLRLNFDRSMIDDGSDYHPFVHNSRVSNPDAPSSEGWQLRYILALIYAMCIGTESQKARMFQNSNEIDGLLLFSGAVPSADHCELGRGYISRTQSGE